MSLQNQIIDILSQVLQLNPDVVGKMGNDTHLIGAIPEFDSMAVVSVITALEDSFGFIVDDDEIDAAVFETVGSLVAFVEQKLT
jgi:acyl carrier protein